MTFVYPPRNLPGTAENWGRAVEARDNILSTDVTAQSQKLDNALRATGGQLAVMSSQIDSIVTQQATLLAQQDTLQAQQATLLAQQDTLQAQQKQLINAGTVQVADTGNTQTTFTASGTWGAPRPSVVSNSLSGRFQITVSGSANGGQVFYTFSTTGYNRTRILGGTPSAIRGRVESSGGAVVSFASSKSFFIQLTPNTNYTFFLDYTSPNATVGAPVIALAGQIVVQPTL